MSGKIGFNWLFGAMGFILTFLVSFTNNVMVTVLLRSLIAFIVWFMLAFALRWLLGIITQPSSEPAIPHLESADEERGSLFDLTTPDEIEELNDLLKQKPGASAQTAEHFSPLSPPKLVKTSEKDPEELAKAVRHLTEKQGG